MSRLPDLPRERMTEAQRRAYDGIVAGPRGSVRGPLGVWVRSPGLAEHAQRLGAFLRYEGSLPGKLRELAILVVARHWTAQFEWYAHAPIAEEEGLDPGIVAAIAARRTPDFGDPAEAAVFAFCTELLETHRVADAAYAAAFERVGEQGVIELVGLVGYYTLVSATLNAFQVPVPPGEDPPLEDASARA